MVKRDNGADATALEKHIAGERAAEDGKQVGDGEELQRNHLAAREKRLHVRDGKRPRR